MAMNLLIEASRRMQYSAENLGMVLYRIRVDSISGDVTLGYRCELCKGAGEIRRPYIGHTELQTFDGRVVASPIFRETREECPNCRGQGFGGCYLGSGH